MSPYWANIEQLDGSLWAGCKLEKEEQDVDGDGDEEEEEEEED
jgi:hypothetical protein